MIRDGDYDHLFTATGKNDEKKIIGHLKIDALTL